MLRIELGWYVNMCCVVPDKINTTTKNNSSGKTAFKKASDQSDIIVFAQALYNWIINCTDFKLYTSGYVRL